MTLLTKQGRPQIVFKRVTRHSWGPDPKRVVVAAVIRDGAEHTARIIGVTNNRAVEVERSEGVTLPGGRGPTRIVHADGSEWVLEGVGCSCHVPGPLRGINPLLVP